MPKPFTFRLETVLRLRKRIEDEQRRVVAAEAQAWEACRQNIDTLRSQVARSIDGARAARLHERVDTFMALQEQRWRLRLHRRIAEKNGELRDLEAKLRTQRQELARRSKERKVIEKLKARRWAEHRGQLARAEQADCDEIGAQVFLRNRSASNAESWMRG
jgi:flagellar FliJ protein